MRAVLPCLGLLALAIAASVRNAAATEWGCEVLLCASSSNPSWHSVAACHPPMERLIEAMSHPGFSWPTCPEAGTGKPGYERFADCPQGWTPASDPGMEHGGGGLSYCVRKNSSCADNRRISIRHGGSCLLAEYRSRPLRSDPYYFDMRDHNDGTLARHWFNLGR